MATTDAVLGVDPLKIVKYKRIGSTNDTAQLLAEQGVSEWTIVTAEVQTKGRGRSGLGWISPKGGLWFSVVLRPEIPIGSLGLLQFFASNSARRTLEEETSVHVQVKWPNDFVHEFGKLGGVLVESKTSGEKVSHVIIGVGLNVNLREDNLPPGAASIYSISGRKHDLETLLSLIITDMKSNYGRLADPFEILDEWWRSCIHRSKRVRVETSKGPVTGTNIGLDPKGLLLVETEKGRERILEGTLRVLGN